MNFKKTKLAISLSLLIMLPALVNAQNEEYEAGQKAIHEQQYEKAYEYFKKAESEKGYRDASLYWQSYVLYKNNQNAKAKRTIEKLIKNHPKSKWIDDAEFLILEHELNNHSKHLAELENELGELNGLKNQKYFETIALNEELKLFAIQQLMFQDEVKGLNKLKELLKTSQDIQIKVNAIEILGISDSEQATKELYEFARQNEERALQNQAIEMLSLRNSKVSQKMLLDLYNINSSKEMKSSIIEGFIHSDEPKKLLELIRTEKDTDLSQQMVELLGVMGAKEELRLLSKNLKGIDKSALINAMAISGDSESIKDMIAMSEDIETQSRAIQSLIILDDDGVENYLQDLYKSVNNERLKHEIISVFAATSSSPNHVVEIFKNETNKELKSRLIESLMVMDAKDALLKLQSKEKDPGLSSQIIETVSYTHLTLPTICSV